MLVHDWGRYDYGSPIIRPAQMAPEAMIDATAFTLQGLGDQLGSLARVVTLLDSPAEEAVEWNT